jgi:hypothetical protein
MRYVAIHDRHGSISTLIAGSDDGPPLTVALVSGQQATEVNPEEIGLDFAKFDTEEAALDALNALRVDVEFSARLVRRDGDQAP